VLTTTRRKGVARAGGHRGTRSGFTLTEIALAVAVFGLVAGSTVYSLLHAKYLSWTNRERGIALEAAQSAMEQVRGDDFRNAFANFNGGTNFAVPGLNVIPGDPDGFVGEIFFPGDGVQLLENFVDRELGMPRDLDLDGTIDGADHAPDYEVLPVRVRVQWRGPRGNEQVELITTLTERWGGAP
jgi:prepilin-type N-terminal cleavage/methylation domain-containing protein